MSGVFVEDSNVDLEDSDWSLCPESPLETPFLEASRSRRLSSWVSSRDRRLESWIPDVDSVDFVWVILWYLGEQDENDANAPPSRSPSSLSSSNSWL